MDSGDDEEIIKAIEADMMKMVKNLSEEEEKILQNAFRTIDTNHNGFLDPSEIRLYLLIKWKEAIDIRTIESMVGLADVNKDGLISYQEFVRLQLKCMPLCRGYCDECKKVILGIDGWTCPKCDPESFKGDKRTFSLCLQCYSKGESQLKPHEHPYKDFNRLRISGISDDTTLKHLEPTTDVYNRKILKPLLQKHIRKVERGEDDEAYWYSVMKCLQQ